jgi:bile acid:Na+ symporter, BASS family
MDLKQLVLLAFQVSIMSTVFGFGLGATSDDLLYLVRRPNLFLRSFTAMFVIVPVVALVLDTAFSIAPEIKIVLTALAISPVPPLLPNRLNKAGGLASYGLGLMATFALLSIAIVPISVEILERFFGRPFAIAPAALTGLVLKGAVLPLVTGVIVRAVLPALAARLEKPVSLFGKGLLVLASLPLLVGIGPAIWARIGDGTLLAMTVFAAVGLAVGHVLAGRDRDHQTVLALSSACRHPGIALTIAASNYPDQRFGAAILLYLIVGAVVCLPYIAWQRRSTGVSLSAA